MRRYKLFNFLEKTLEYAQIDTVTAKELEELSFRELALHIAISYIANAISKCEFKTYENNEEVKNELYYLLNVSPNPNQNSSEFINQIIETLCYEGEALVILHNDFFYCADSFDVDDSNPLKEYTYHNISINGCGIKKKYKANEVFHYKLENTNVSNLVKLAYEKYGEVLAAAFKSFKRNNGKKYKMALEQYRAGDTKFAEIFDKVLKKQLQDFVESDDAVYPQYKGIDLEELPQAVSNANDIIVIRKEIFDTTAQAFKIPLPMMYGNITNINDIVKTFIAFAVEPITDMLGEETTRKRYDFHEWKNGNYVEVDTSCINYIDIFEIADKADKIISSALASIDEVRPRIRLKPLNTDFSTSHFITKNYELAENAMNSNPPKGGEEEE